VHGLSLSEIPEASDIKLVFNGHGDDKGLERTTADRTYRDIPLYNPIELCLPQGGKRRR
jgi:hypothetical protein